MRPVWRPARRAYLSKGPDADTWFRNLGLESILRQDATAPAKREKPKKPVVSAESAVPTQNRSHLSFALKALEPKSKPNRKAVGVERHVGPKRSLGQHAKSGVVSSSQVFQVEDLLGPKLQALFENASQWKQPSKLAREQVKMNRKKEHRKMRARVSWQNQRVASREDVRVDVPTVDVGDARDLSRGLSHARNEDILALELDLGSEDPRRTSYVHSKHAPADVVHPTTVAAGASCGPSAENVPRGPSTSIFLHPGAHPTVDRQPPIFAPSNDVDPTLQLDPAPWDDLLFHTFLQPSRSPSLLTPPTTRSLRSLCSHPSTPLLTHTTPPPPSTRTPSEAQTWFLALFTTPIAQALITQVSEAAPPRTSAKRARKRIPFGMGREWGTQEVKDIAAAKRSAWDSDDAPPIMKKMVRELWNPEAPPRPRDTEIEVELDGALSPSLISTLGVKRADEDLTLEERNARTTIFTSAASITSSTSIAASNSDATTMTAMSLADATSTIPSSPTVDDDEEDGLVKIPGEAEGEEGDADVWGYRDFDVAALLGLHGFGGIEDTESREVKVRAAKRTSGRAKKRNMH